MVASRDLCGLRKHRSHRDLDTGSGSSAEARGLAWGQGGKPCRHIDGWTVAAGLYYSVSGLDKSS